MQLPDSQPETVSLKEFLPILSASEIKLELVDGVIVPFANGTMAHRFICERLVRFLSGAVEPGCELFTSDVALRRTDAPTYVFPDASYTCESLDAAANDIVAPTLVVEVVSPKSIERDRVDKLDTYQAIPSVREYLIVDSRRVWVCAYRRLENAWIQLTYGLNDTIELLSMAGARLKVADLYDGTEHHFPSP